MKQKLNFLWVVISMVKSDIFKFVDSLKIRKPEYLENESLFFIQTKKNHSLYIKSYNMAKKIFFLIGIHSMQG